MKTIRIRMLGEFSISCGENTISDAEARSKKVWSLLAYLIYNRERGIPHQKLIDLLWGEDSSSSNPENAMRITMHRARGLLDQLYEGAGRELIVRRESGYTWNDDVETIIDCDDFMRLTQSEEGMDEDEHLRRMLEALELYQGEFLPRQASEMWAIPVATHFHARYLSTTMEASELLSARNRHDEAASVCRRATSSEPYHEPLYQRLIQELAAAGDIKGAAAVYEKLCKRLEDDFGIQPGEETRAVYRNATLSPKEKMLTESEVQEDLFESDDMTGAMQCDYDYFKVLCYAESRSMQRNGTITHIALMSVSADKGASRSKDSVSRIMDMLGEELKQNLRLGDVISRCSATQYIIMLPRANYENSCMVCRRVIAAFKRNYALAEERVHFIVQPLTARMRVFP